jgi:hypothetical protein
MSEIVQRLSVKTMDKHWCMCTKLKAVYRDGWSTCSVCGGKDAYGTARRPPGKEKRMNPQPDQMHCHSVDPKDARLAELEARLESANEIIEEVAHAGVSFEDSRVGYVEVQIGPRTIKMAQEWLDEPREP